MKTQLLLYHFQQLKLFLFITSGVSALFIHVAVGHSPTLESMALLGFVIIISITLGIVQVQSTYLDKNNSDLYLLHLPIEKSHVWLIRSISGVMTLFCFYYILKTLAIFNPSSPTIDIMILALGIFCYYLSRSVCVYIKDQVQVIFISLLILVSILTILQPIYFIPNPSGIAFPIFIHGPHILALTLFSIVSSLCIELKYFKQSIN
jgi:hypothetical protein